MTVHGEKSTALYDAGNEEGEPASCTEPDVLIREDYLETSDGVRLRTIDFTPPCHENGRPLILLVAGWISLISAWKEVLRVITPRFKTVYIETREKRSAHIDWKSSPHFSMERMTRDLAEVVEKKVPSGHPFCLVGSSLGSTIILEYLAQTRRCPILSIAVAPNAEFGIPKWFFPIGPFVPCSAYGIIKNIIKWYLRTYRVDSAREREQALKYERSLDAAEPRRLKANALAMKNYSLWPKLEKIKDPVIIVAARTDTLHDMKDMKRMVGLIPSARLEIME
ncbi:MAG: alpha/beta hydrolase, partial [Anaerovoracaceae bacterium]